MKIRENTKEKIKIMVLSISLTILLFAIILNLLFILFPKQINSQINSVSEEVLNIYFEKTVKKYQNDSEVLKIVEKCKNNKTIIECVHYNIPFEYDDYRAENGVGILSPSEMIKRKGKGVCRDYSVMVRATLSSLNINSIFVFEPEHVYVIAFEDGKSYCLENGMLSTKIKEKIFFKMVERINNKYKYLKFFI